MTDWELHIKRFKVGNVTGALYRSASPRPQGGSFWKWRNNIFCAGTFVEARDRLRRLQPAPADQVTYITEQA